MVVEFLSLTKLINCIPCFFADDVAGFSESVFGLQRIIDCIATFTESVGMKLNLEKTKIIVFRNGGLNLKILKNGSIKEIILMLFLSTSILECIIPLNFFWTKTKYMSAKQAIKAYCSILRYQRNFGRFDSKDLFKLFDTMVKPILCYGSEILGFKYAENIEKIQVKFCKR